MGGLDLAPLVLIFAILALQVLISNNLMGAAYY